jgi:hypothetical protein
MMPYYDLRKRLERVFLWTLIAGSVCYGLFRAYPLVAGPSIVLYSPAEGDYVASTTFEVSGRVERASVITLQGKPITIDVDGHFSETLVAQLPYTILVLVAKDAYGETVSKEIRVIPQ